MPTLKPEIRRSYDPEFKFGAVRIVLETGKPIAQVARDLGIHAGTLGNWVKKERLDRADNGQLDEDSMAELVRLRKEVAELRMERDVLKRSVVLWVKEATRWAWCRISPPRGPIMGSPRRVLSAAGGQ